MALPTDQASIGVLDFECPLCRREHQATGYVVKDAQVWGVCCEVTGRSAETVRGSAGSTLDARSVEWVARDLVAALRWAARPPARLAVGSAGALRVPTIEEPARAAVRASTLSHKAIALQFGDEEIPAPALEPRLRTVREAVRHALDERDAVVADGRAPRVEDARSTGTPRR
jgi:hypothetical protein